MVIGMNDDDMALCANTLIDCGGGMAVVNQGNFRENRIPLRWVCDLPMARSRRRASENPALPTEPGDDI